VLLELKVLLVLKVLKVLLEGQVLKVLKVHKDLKVPLEVYLLNIISQLTLKRVSVVDMLDLMLHPQVQLVILLLVNLI
jgi:hypothetical protein